MESSVAGCTPVGMSLPSRLSAPVALRGWVMRVWMRPKPTAFTLML